MPDNPELSAILELASKKSEARSHDISSELGSDVSGLGDVTMDRDVVSNVTIGETKHSHGWEPSCKANRR